MSRKPKYDPDATLLRAQYGEISDKEAEAYAVKQGWPPFASRPDNSEFDPMAQSRWPLVMVVAWIAWRDIDATREQCAEYRARWSHWLFRQWKEPGDKPRSFVTRKGWFVEMRSSATVSRLSLSDIARGLKNDFPPTRQMTVRDAEKALLAALANGALVAEALNKDGKPVDIPSRDWSYLKLVEDRDCDVLKYDSSHRDPDFTQVKIARTEVLRHWPAPSTKIGVENACQQWLSGLMRSSPKAKPKPRSAFLMEAKQKFRGLGKRQFDRAWDKAIAESGTTDVWARAGRLKKIKPRRGSK